MSAPSRTQTAMLSVYHGQRCIGFVMHRGKLGHEAFDDIDVSLGVFETQDEAADALTRALIAHGCQS